MKEKRVFRFTIANVEREDIGRRLSQAGIAGTIFESLGFWHNPEKDVGELEPGITLEIAVDDSSKVFKLVQDILIDLSESAAYFTVDGRDPKLFTLDGEVEELEG